MTTACLDRPVHPRRLRQPLGNGVERARTWAQARRAAHDRRLLERAAAAHLRGGAPALPSRSDPWYVSWPIR